MSIDREGIRAEQDKAKRALRATISDVRRARLSSPVYISTAFQNLDCYAGNMSDLSDDDNCGSGYWSDLNALLNVYRGEDLPPFVYLCEWHQPSVDWGDVVDYITGVLADQRYGGVDEDEIEGWADLQAAVERFNAAQTDLGAWVANFIRIVVIDQARFDAFLEEV